MSDTESLEYNSNSDGEERSAQASHTLSIYKSPNTVVHSNHTPNDATYTMFYLARPAPTKTSQKLPLRPKLILQVQLIRYKAHAMPIIGLWLPSVLNLGMAKNAIPEADLCMSDIYVCRHEDYPFLKSDIADQEDDVIAVIRKRNLRNGANGSPIHFRGGHLVTACRSIEGHYQCTWEDASRGLLTMKSHITEGGGSEGSPFEISDCTGVQNDIGMYG